MIIYRCLFTINSYTSTTNTVSKIQQVAQYLDLFLLNNSVCRHGNDDMINSLFRMLFYLWLIIKKRFKCLCPNQLNFWLCQALIFVYCSYCLLSTIALIRTMIIVMLPKLSRTFLSFWSRMLEESFCVIKLTINVVRSNDLDLTIPNRYDIYSTSLDYELYNIYLQLYNLFDVHAKRKYL